MGSGTASVNIGMRENQAGIVGRLNGEVWRL